MLGKRQSLGKAGKACTSTSRYLLVHRVDDGTWSIPGGHLEHGEGSERAARRELLEETGLCVVELNRHARSLRYSYVTYHAEVGWERAPRLNHEHDDWTWATREEALGMRLHPGLREVLATACPTRRADRP